MIGKLALVVGAATGYVLGTRDGRERYEQLKTQVEKLRTNPTVQKKASQAADLGRQKAQEAVDKAKGSSGSGSSGSANGSGIPEPGDATPADMPASRPTPAAPQSGGSGV